MTTAGRRRTARATPKVTIGLIAVLVVTFIIQEVRPETTEQLWLAPVLVESRPWSMLSAALVHGSITHLAFNCLALYWLGRVLEPLFGILRYALLLIVGAAGGSLAVVLLSGGPAEHGFYQPVVGASGAVLALFGALLPLTKRTGQPITSLAVLIAINIGIGFMPGVNISWQAHLGGAVVGLIFGAIYAWAPAKKRPTLTLAALIAIGVAIWIALELYLSSVIATSFPFFAGQ